MLGGLRPPSAYAAVLPRGAEPPATPTTSRACMLGGLRPPSAYAAVLPRRQPPDAGRFVAVADGSVFGCFGWRSGMLVHDVGAGVRKTE
jgi:hypothetical protein